MSSTVTPHCFIETKKENKGTTHDLKRTAVSYNSY